MPDFAINHMTVPNLPTASLFDLATRLGAIGVELRNDLKPPLFEGRRTLFDGEPADTVRDAARAKQLRIVGLSQVYPFNAWSDAIRDEVAALIDTALACGAETISLIPRNDGTGTGEAERRDNATVALGEIRPMLEARGMVALVEPLGFETSSLRSKAETVEIIESLGAAGTYKLVHDTFHHHLAGGGPIFPEHTGIVHLSGVVEQALAVRDMRDGHRVLVDARDRLGNIEQLAELLDAGYAGPVSFEAFSPAIHGLADPYPALAQSIAYINDRLGVAAAA